MIQKIGVIKDGIISCYILHSHNFCSLLFEIKELKRSLTHILCLDMQLETQVFLKDGSFWTVGLWRSNTPRCAPPLLRHRSASTVTQKYTDRQLISHSHKTINKYAATRLKNEIYQQNGKMHKSL